MNAHEKKNAKTFGGLRKSSYLCSRIPPCMINTWVKPPKGGFIFNIRLQMGILLAGPPTGINLAVSSVNSTA